MGKYHSRAADGSAASSLNRAVDIECQKPRKSPFIVDAPTTMLKRNTELSKAARNLYLTLRGLADGKTGELRIKGRGWIPVAAIDKAAEMCRDIRLRAMRELIGLGYVTMQRERVECFKGGRRRIVFGRSHYIVHRQRKPLLKTQNLPKSKLHTLPFPKSQKPNDFGGPVSKIDEKPNVLLQSIPSTVEEIDSQDLPNPPCESVPSAAPGGVGFESREEGRSSSSKHLLESTDDEDAPDSLSKEQNTTQPQPPKPLLREKTHPTPALRVWMQSRISQRCNPAQVCNWDAYLHVAEQEFIENMAVEVQTYLERIAQDFLSHRLEQNPGGAVMWNEIAEALQAETNKHRLPVDAGTFQDAIEFAAATLELVTSSEAETIQPKPSPPPISPPVASPRVKCQTCGKGVPYSAIADGSHHADCSKIKRDQWGQLVDRLGTPLLNQGSDDLPINPEESAPPSC